MTIKLKACIPGMTKACWSVEWEGDGIGNAIRFAVQRGFTEVRRAEIDGRQLTPREIADMARLQVYPHNCASVFASLTRPVGPEVRGFVQRELHADARAGEPI